MSIALTPDKAKLRRLRGMLGLFFIVLMIPVGALLFFAFQQMKWEVFHQHRQQAEAFVKRVNEEIFRFIDSENARPPQDYRFVVHRQATKDFRIERSELSKLPESLSIPGLVGYFQIGPAGEFSSPLLPESVSVEAQALLNPTETSLRMNINRRLQQILTTDVDVPRGNLAPPGVAEDVPLGSAQDQATSSAKQENRAGREISAVDSSAESLYDTPIGGLARFDAKASKAYQQNKQRLGSVSELALDDSLEQKSQRNADQESANILSAEPAAAASPPLARRKEQAIELKKILPTPSSPEIITDTSQDDLLVREQSFDLLERDLSNRQKQLNDNTQMSQAARYREGEQKNYPSLSVSSFESEIEQFRLSIFDDEHLVIHRNVWQNGGRLVQGLVLRRQTFIDHFIQNAYFSTSLSNTSRLLVAFNDDVLNIFSLPDESRYISNANHLSGGLLYQGSLVAPFQGFSLILNVVELPLGASIEFLGAVTGVMFFVLVIGFYFIYRYGKKQIALVRQQQDFVSAVSHELKTPLTSIRMYSEMLKNDWADEQKKATYYDYIHGESERLSRLIENVLQLARINRKQNNQSDHWIGVGELLANTSSSVSSLIEANGFTLNQYLSPAARDCKIYGNADSALQILINLIDNAVKFSRQSTLREIDLRTDVLGNGVLEIAVRDHGPGVSETQMKKIFELFYRSENELTRETVGTGIGLNLVRELALAMGATIDVRNCSPGAEFSIRWPAKLVKSVQKR